MQAITTASAMYGGNVWQGTLYGAIGGAAFGAIGVYYGNDYWGWDRVVVSGLAGGGLSELSGGRFEYGFAMAASAALAMNGWQRMGSWTNDSSLKGDGTPVYDENGELFTTGNRRCIGCTEENQNWFTKGGKYEGDEGWIYRSRTINLISKVHDFMNGWGYQGTGNYIAGGELYNTAYSTYSYAGMPLAAMYTGFAFSAQYFQPVIYNFRR
ncbi:MAG: hypothetical protein NG784_07880 [Candidatus Jettenia sp.]|nr:hypothetical protein [Candidatus Jettenia sp.]